MIGCWPDETKTMMSSEENNQMTSFSSSAFFCDVLVSTTMEIAIVSHTWTKKKGPRDDFVNI